MPSWSSKPSFLAACEANGESGGASTACGTKFHCYAGRHVDLRRLEARDDLGALVWQAGEGARVHRRLRQRRRGVAGSLYEEHLGPGSLSSELVRVREARRVLSARWWRRQSVTYTPERCWKPSSSARSAFWQLFLRLMCLKNRIGRCSDARRTRQPPVQGASRCVQQASRARAQETMYPHVVHDDFGHRSKNRLA